MRKLGLASVDHFHDGRPSRSAYIRPADKQCHTPRASSRCAAIGLVVAGDEGDGRANASIGDGDRTSLGKGDSRQIGEHAAGRQLDEQSDTELEEQGSSVVPADRPFDALGQVVTDLLRVAQRAATDIAQVRYGGRDHGNAGEGPLGVRRDRSHEGRVGRCWHGEAPDTVGAVLASEARDPLQGFITPATHTCRGALTLAE